MHPRYVWQQRKPKVEVDGFNKYQSMEVKKQRKILSKKLRSIQVPGRYTHTMDDEMFDTVVQMLESKTDTDIQMARDIIYNSKMKEHHMNLFISRYYSAILNELSPFHAAWTTW